MHVGQCTLKPGKVKNFDLRHLHSNLPQACLGARVSSVNLLGAFPHHSTGINTASSANEAVKLLSLTGILDCLFLVERGAAASRRVESAEFKSLVQFSTGSTTVEKEARTAGKVHYVPLKLPGLCGEK